MPQATTQRKGALEASPGLDLIEAGISTIAHASNQVRLHEHLLELAGVRLDRAGAHLLSKLYASGDQALRVTDLAERIGVDTPTVTRKIQQLERLGYVRRAEDASDRRAHRIALTASGRRLVERLRAARQRWLATLLDGWAESDVQRFGHLLSRFAEELREQLGALHG